MRQLLSEVRQSKKVQLDADGYAEVRVHVSDDSDFLSVFSVDENPLIARETAEYIEHSLKHIRPKTKLHFRFISREIDGQERVLYDRAIRNYYHSEFIEVCEALRRNAVQTWIMVLLAAVFFTAAVTLEARGVQTVFLNMLDVVAWVFMWEAVDIYAFQRSSMKLRRMRFVQIIKAKITFQ